jgi:hypothetical protein
VKRLALHICVLLLVGAIVNLAVTSALALGLGLSRGSWQGAIERDRWDSMQDGEARLQGWAVERRRRAGACRIQAWWSPDRSGGFESNTTTVDEIVPSWAAAYLEMRDVFANPEFWNEDVDRVRVIDARGWPLLSLWGAFTIQDTANSLTPTVESHWSVLVRDGFPGWGDWETQVLPLRPLWPGFLLNTLFYAAILGLFFFIPGRVRRTLRLRRGLCPVCAYPRGANDACTECGAPQS